MKNMTLQSIGKALRNKEFSCRELTQTCLEIINQKNDKLGAFLSAFEEDALKKAVAFDARNDSEKWNSPLAGIPFAAKDNLCYGGHPTTCASRILENFVPPYTATVLSKLEEGGAILMGKTNMDEFGMGATCEYSALAVTRNPIDPRYVPGGSSGGSAAAVASGMVPFALGSDTGGSVRLPASYCGIVGMRPTYGSVSRYGLTAFCSSMDTVGPLTCTVSDNRLVMSAIMGPDPRDATCRGAAVQIDQNKTCPLRVGILSQLMTAAISPTVRQSVLAAAKRLEGEGAVVEEVTVPHLKDALFAYFILSSAEASSNLARYDGVRYGKRQEGESLDSLYKNSRTTGFGEEVKRRIRLGTYALTRENKEAYYERSLIIRSALQAEFAGIFLDYDLLLCPTAPDTAPLLGQMQTPTDLYRLDHCNVPMSLAGLPALSIPYGKDEKGLPIGIQLVGAPYSEALLYSVAERLEGGTEDAV